MQIEAPGRLLLPAKVARGDRQSVADRNPRTGTVCGCPVRAPVVVSMTTGRPAIRDVMVTRPLVSEILPVPDRDHRRNADCHGDPQRDPVRCSAVSPRVATCDWRPARGRWDLAGMARDPKP